MLPSSAAAACRTSSSSSASQESARQDVINQARDAVGHENIIGAISILRAKLGYDQHTFHNAVLSLLDSSSSHHRKELVKEILRQYPYFDLNVHGREGRTALDLAVRDDDHEFARYLLGKGGKPEKVFIASASDGMKALITAWRRTTQLYAHFNNRNSLGLTPLDQALRAGDFQRGREHLDGEMKDGKSVHDIWNKALADRKKDVLRALLIAGKPEELRELMFVKPNVGEWQKALRDDPGLSAVLKEFPYQSAKRGRPENFNGRAIFAGNRQQLIISCVHLATYHLMEQMLKPRRKFDYRKFGSPEEIARNVKLDIEQTCREFKAQASEGHIVDNAKFGQFLVKQFEAIERESDRPRKMLLQSSNHMMNLILMIKEEQGKKSYVVEFYNPSETKTSTRRKTDSLQKFETQLLEDYLRGGVAAIRIYYPETEGTSNKGKSMIFVQPEGAAQTGNASSSIPGVGRTLAASLDPKDVDSSVIWHLMYSGFDGSLKRLRDYFYTLSEDQRIELLSRKYGSTSAPALLAGMQEGHANAIRCYGELLESIPLEQRIELLVAKNKQGTPALFIAMLVGKAEAIRAYGELLASIFAEHNESRPVKRQKIDLNELSSLMVDNEQFIDLLAAKNADHIPALFIVMMQGTIETFDAYAELLKPVSPDRKAELLLAKNSEGPYKGRHGLEIAIHLRKFEMAERCISMLNQIAPNLSENKRKELLDELVICDLRIIYNEDKNSSSSQKWAEMDRSLMKLRMALGG